MIRRILKAAKRQLMPGKYFTSFDYGHRHTWKPGDKYTSKDGFHTHKIDEKKKLAVLGGIWPHKHKLLKE